MSQRIPIVNTEDMAFLCQKEEVFLRISEQYGAPPEWHRPAGFVTLCQFILEQQVSTASAKAHYEALEAHVSAFTPEVMANLAEEEYRSCHISRQKTRYIKGLAQAILDETLNLERLPHLGEEEIRRELTAIKGIGNWTADVYLLLCLGAHDIMPFSDIAVIRSLETLFGLEDREAMVAKAESWRPKRSLATFLLWWDYLKRRNREY